MQPPFALWTYLLIRPWAEQLYNLQGHYTRKMWVSLLKKWEKSAFVCMLSCFSRVRLFAALWTVAPQTSLSMGFPRQDTGVGCHALLQGIFTTQGLNSSLSHLLHWWVSSLPVAATGRLCSTWEINFIIYEHAELSLAPGRVLCLNDCLPLSFSPHWFIHHLWFIQGHPSSEPLEGCCLLDMAFVHVWYIRSF